MLQENVGRRPKLRQTRRLPTSLSQNTVRDNKAVCAEPPRGELFAIFGSVRAGVLALLRATTMLLCERTSAGGERNQHAGSEPHALRLRSQGDLEPSRPDEELHSVFVSEWRILRTRTICPCSSHWLAESIHPVERSTEASVATSRCARWLIGGDLPHGEELRPRWSSSDARDVGGGGRRRWLQTRLRRGGVPHGVSPRSRSAALPRIRDCSRDSCEQLAHADLEVRGALWRVAPLSSISSASAEFQRESRARREATEKETRHRCRALAFQCLCEHGLACGGEAANAEMEEEGQEGERDGRHRMEDLEEAKLCLESASDDANNDGPKVETKAQEGPGVPRPWRGRLLRSASAQNSFSPWTTQV